VIAAAVMLHERDAIGRYSLELHMMSKEPPSSFVALIVVLLLLSAGSARADQDWTYELGGGTTPTVGDVSSRLNTGWNVDVRAGRDLNSGFGVFGEFMFNGVGVSDQVLQALQVPDGSARVWSLTAGPVWRFPIGNKAHGYLLGSIGWTRRTVEFTQPTVGIINVIDPWWGYIGPVLVPANQILGSVTENAFGGNVGAGASFALGNSGASAFAEVRYFRANTSPTSTTLVPITFGVRFIR
jgi:hypothetical protein